MSTALRRTGSAIIDRLVDNAGDFDFVQAVRLLERLQMAANHASLPVSKRYPVGGFRPPRNEILRFDSSHSFEFPATEIQGLDMSSQNDAEPWRLMINFIGLCGSMGVMPYHYTELLQSRIKQKDPAMQRFLRLFNHRSISLFYQASIKYRLPLQYERHRLFANPGPPPPVRPLLALVGLATEGLNDRLQVGDETIIHFAGLFNQRMRTVVGLRQLLRASFRLPVEIEQFIGQWHTINDDFRSKLADFEAPNGRNARLGHSAMLGSRGWFSQSRIRIILGPLDKQGLRRFAPGGNTLKSLNEVSTLR